MSGTSFFVPETIRGFTEVVRIRGVSDWQNRVSMPSFPG
jgi:hypothetical protein